MTAKRRALLTFAEDDKPKTGTNCWLCNLPERAEVEAAAAAGVQKSTVFRWLRDECGYQEAATLNKVDGHLRNHVQKTSS